MNWTYTATAPEKFLDIHVYFFVKLKKIFFKFFLFYFLLKFPNTPPLLLNFHFHIFLWLFSIREKNFFLSFFSFLFLVFLSYFLLKSSNTPLLFLNFHFHLTITLQKKKKRSPIFKLNFIYISKFWVFVFKYFISKSLTSTLNFLIFVFQYVI